MEPHSNPLHLVPVAAGLIVGIGNVSLKLTDNFQLSGIALGTLIVLIGYHALRVMAPARMTDEPPLLEPDNAGYDRGVPGGS
ncbi:hypothetical protein SAMN02787144_105215 [Streptomyces atratus]|uniref:Uracil permease n=1 Tax=Streptomyces atratus TaxID=1893 RepID=A0A1K2FCF8_STRAR|nr:hypothetical protein SAMN02787144_105215 [Streptomyces atratus]